MRSVVAALKKLIQVTIQQILDLSRLDDWPGMSLGRRVDNLMLANRLGNPVLRRLI